MGKVENGSSGLQKYPRPVDDILHDDGADTDAHFFNAQSDKFYFSACLVIFIAYLILCLNFSTPAALFS